MVPFSNTVALAGAMLPPVIVKELNVTSPVEERAAASLPVGPPTRVEYEITPPMLDHSPVVLNMITEFAMGLESLVM